MSVQDTYSSIFSDFDENNMVGQSSESCNNYFLDVNESNQPIIYSLAENGFEFDVINGIFSDQFYVRRDSLVTVNWGSHNVALLPKDVKRLNGDCVVSVCTSLLSPSSHFSYSSGVILNEEFQKTL